MRAERTSGILLHPSSLPGAYGIGDLGPPAYRYLDWLSEAGCGLWQVLPLGPTGYGDSPYQCFSAFAGNPYLISPEFLLRNDLLHPDDPQNTPDFPMGRVDYGKVIPWKLTLLERAFIRFEASPEHLQHAFDRFCAEHVNWLPDYALFMAIKEANGGGSWSGWSEALRKREPAALADAGRRHAAAVRRYSFYQFLFFRQWDQLRSTAHERGIRIIGDIPIFVAYDSADVWAHPEYFFLDEDRQPTFVAGVPPDYFSKTGQLWGNPLYRWDVLQGEGYRWWLDRLQATLRMVDEVRLDHFRGFAGYWEIPAGNLTAETGRWVPGPGEDFFRIVREELGDLPIIAEDLGEITPDVTALRDKFDLPGMKILQFGFTGPENAFLPHNFLRNCVVYTGTHDNDTARGWFATAPDQEKDFALRYLHTTPGGFTRALIRAAWSSVANYAVAPLQDFLDLGTEGRMNYPGRLGGNWTWRVPEDALSEQLKNEIAELNGLYSR
jgi:4-alpha-glucanotransferase